MVLTKMAAINVVESDGLPTLYRPLGKALKGNARVVALRQERLAKRQRRPAFCDDVMKSKKHANDDCTDPDPGGDDQASQTVSYVADGPTGATTISISWQGPLIEDYQAIDVALNMYGPLYSPAPPANKLWNCAVNQGGQLFTSALSLLQNLKNNIKKFSPAARTLILGELSEDVAIGLSITDILGVIILCMSPADFLIFLALFGYAAWQIASVFHCALT